MARPILPVADPWSYLAPTGPALFELKEKGSRFLAHLVPISETEEARAKLHEVKRRLHDATHHCWAFRVGWGAAIAERTGDGSEPSHTAGQPILAAMVSRSVSDSLLVVVRWFGGVKLGTGGLRRAYEAAASGALDSSDLEVRSPSVEYSIAVPYNSQGRLRHLLDRLGLRVASEQFGEAWEASVSVPMGKRDRFEEALAALRETLGGEALWKSK